MLFYESLVMRLVVIQLLVFRLSDCFCLRVSFHFGDGVVGPSVQPPARGGGTPYVSLVQGWVKSGLDSRRLSYLSALVAEGLGFAAVVRVTSVSPCVSSVPLRVWTPLETLVCDILCGSASLVL